ncbi:MAG TPA: hypothetical protein VGF95_13150 [Solirubrobacteraceae bacterium]|jgi:hypothetical protein
MDQPAAPPPAQAIPPQAPAELPQTQEDDVLSSTPVHQGQDAPRSIDHRRERICVQTEKHRIEGYVTLARDGFRSRVSDMLNASERDFLTLTDATVQPLDGGPAESHRFLAVARRHIVFAVVADPSEG